MNKISYYYTNKAHYTYLIIKIFKGFFWKIVNYLSAYWWGVEIGSDCSYMGKTHFSRLQNAKIKIGKKCKFNSTHKSNKIGVYSPCMLSTVKKGAIIEIGDNCGFSGTVIGAALHIKLGNNVRCGANTLITDTDWHTDDYRTNKDREIIIEDNVWLGYGVKVLKGVHIGKNSLVGANSVVTKDIPADVVVAGNPCKIIRQLDPPK